MKTLLAFEWTWRLTSPRMMVGLLLGTLLLTAAVCWIQGDIIDRARADWLWCLTRTRCL